MRRPVVSVIGSDDATPAEVAAAEALGTALVDRGWRVACGGRGGVMAAVCRGARASEAATGGDTIGILPGEDDADANPHLDVALPTGLGMARNALVVLAGDAVVAVGGRAGTLSEIALAWQYGKPIVALGVGGWASRLGGEALDARPREAVVAAADVAETVACLEGWLDGR